MFSISIAKTVSAFALGAMSLLIAGCGSSQPAIVPVPPQQTSPIEKPNNILQGEAFYARTGRVECKPEQYNFYVASFHVSGVARGALPGRFTATGYWGWNTVDGSIGFKETFKIKSGSRTIHDKLSYASAASTDEAKANCRIFGSGGFTLRLHYHGGKAASAYIVRNGKFRERFH
jgi:hypothetical protein